MKVTQLLAATVAMQVMFDSPMPMPIRIGTDLRIRPLTKQQKAKRKAAKMAGKARKINRK